MEFFFEILFTIHFSHKYFQDNKLKCFDIVPSSETLISFKKIGLIYRVFENGFSVLYESSYLGRKRTKTDVLKIGAVLKFLIVNKDPYFFNYTDSLTEYDMTTSILYFTNSGSYSSGKLHVSEYVQKNDVKRDFDKTCSVSQVKPFGVIDISTAEIDEGNYRIQFKSKETFWRYILVTDYLKDLEKPAIISKEDSTAFNGPVNFTLPDSRQALVFTSPEPIRLCNKQELKFQLVENFNSETGKYKVIRSVLPYPDVSRILVIDGKAGSAELVRYSEIII